MPPPSTTSTNNPTPTPPETIHQITTTLLDRYSLPISPTYLTTFLSSTRLPLPPTQALTSTLHFRLLASDITVSLSPTTSTFPPTIADPTIKEQRLQNDIPVQLLDILDVGRSRSAQLETLEMIQRGETIKGREIIRTVDLEGGGERGAANTGNGSASAAVRTNANVSNSNNANAMSAGPFKLLLQDTKGNKMYAFTVVPIPRVGMPIPLPLSGTDNGSGTGATTTAAAGVGTCNIGCKMVLKKGAVVRRGVVMLKPGDVNVLGGKVDEWDKQWREMEGRKKRLQVT